MAIKNIYKHALSVSLFGACMVGAPNLLAEPTDAGAMMEWSRYNLTTSRLAVAGPNAVGTGAWSALPWTDVDAGFRFRKNGAVYLFRGTQYAKFTGTTDLRLVTGYPQTIGVGGWRGGPSSGINAVIHHPTDGFVYFFCGDEYWRFHVVNDRFESLPGRLGVDSWPGVWPSGVDDAVFHKAHNAVYFFKGREYLRFDLATNQVAPGYPRAIGESDFRGVRPEVSAAIDITDTLVDFLHPLKSLPDVTALFNLPNPATPNDRSILNEYSSLLLNATSSSKAYFSVPGWDDTALAKDVVAAYDAGVDVKIIANGWGTRWYNVHSGVRTIVSANGRNEHFMRFGGDPGLTTLGLTGITHAKLAAFSDAGTLGQQIVLIGSSNWRAGDTNRQNSVVKITGDTSAYTEVERMLSRLYALYDSSPAQTSDWTMFGKTAVIDRSLQIHLLPSLSGQPTADDPILARLLDVQCKPDTTVWVNMATWPNSGRGDAVLDRLEALKACGADVRVVAHKTETTSGVWSRLQTAGVPWAKTDTHSKYVLISGVFASAPAPTVQNIVIAGSLNLDVPVAGGRQLEADATLIDHPVWFSFRENWLAVCRAMSSGSPGVCTDA